MKHLQWKNLLLLVYLFNVEIFMGMPFFETGDTKVFKEVSCLQVM